MNLLQFLIFFITIVEKANVFNEFFASQCTPLENSTQLPSLLLMNTNKSLNTVSIKKGDLTSIIKSLRSTKAHGFDNIPIRMIQLWGFHHTPSCPNL